MDRGTAQGWHTGGVATNLSRQAKEPAATASGILLKAVLIPLCRLGNRRMIPPCGRRLADPSLLGRECP